MKKLFCLLGAIIGISSLAQATIISRPFTYVNGTVIDANQVNPNETTIYNDYNGNINSSNIQANGINYSNLSTSIQSQLTALWYYRRPVLQFVNTTSTVAIEAGLSGTSGQVTIVFADGSRRTDSNVGHIQINLSQDMALTGTTQSGLMSGSLVANTWYACYAVESQANTTDIIGVCGTVLPIQANYSSLNSTLGTSTTGSTTVPAWVYLGMIRYGNNADATTSIINFTQSGNFTMFLSSCAASNLISTGMRLNNNAAIGSLAWTYSAGTNGEVVPNNVTNGVITAVAGTSANTGRVENNSACNGTHLIYSMTTMASIALYAVLPTSLTNGVCVAQNASTSAMDLYLNGFYDSALGPPSSNGL